MREFLDATHAAKGIRRALARSFPGQKFSVRTEKYAGGSCVTVSYKDGPPLRDVETIADQYRTARFNGMNDLGYSVSLWQLPDGTVKPGNSPGSGMGDGYRNEKPHPDAVEITFGQMYVSVSRSYSREGLQTFLDAWPAIAAVAEIADGYLKITGWPEPRFVWPGDTLSHEASQILARVDLSPTATNGQQPARITAHAAYILRGDTKPHKDEIKAAGGVWVKYLPGGAAWVIAEPDYLKISNLDRQEVTT